MGAQKTALLPVPSVKGPPLPSPAKTVMAPPGVIW